MEPLLPEDEWAKNVGSESYPVSFLHEYAVGLIWDLLHTQKGPVKLPTMDGSRSGDVVADIDRIIIPDALQSVAGYIPGNTRTETPCKFPSTGYQRWVLLHHERRLRGKACTRDRNGYAGATRCCKAGL